MRTIAMVVAVGIPACAAQVPEPESTATAPWYEVPAVGQLGLPPQEPRGVVEVHVPSAASPTVRAVRITVADVTLEFQGPLEEPLHLLVPGGAQRLDIGVDDGLAEPLVGSVVVTPVFRCRVIVQSNRAEGRQLELVPDVVCPGRDGQVTALPSE